MCFCEHRARVRANDGLAPRGPGELERLRVWRWQHERRDDEKCEDERRDERARRAEILRQVAAAVVAGDADAEDRERHGRSRDRHAGHEERPAGDVQVLPAAREGEQPAPLGKVRDAERGGDAVRQHAHRFGDVEDACRPDEDPDDPELGERDERRSDLLTR